MKTVYVILMFLFTMSAAEHARQYTKERENRLPVFLAWLGILGLITIAEAVVVSRISVITAFQAFFGDGLFTVGGDTFGGRLNADAMDLENNIYDKEGFSPRSSWSNTKAWGMHCLPWLVCEAAVQSRHWHILNFMKWYIKTKGEKAVQPCISHYRSCVPSHPNDL